MRTVVKNTTAITLDEADRILSGTDIALEDKRIIALGEAPPDFAPDEVIDGRDLIALPAFFNAHCHAPMTLERGWAEDLPFDRWLNEKIWVAESALEAEDVTWGAALAAAEMIRSGTVGFGDHYFWMNKVAEVVAQSGMKALLAWCHFGIGDDKEVGGVSFEETVAFVEAWEGAAEGRIHTTMGPHSPYMTPTAVLHRFAVEAERLGVGAHFHLSESREQVQNSLERHGLTPPAYVAGLGLLDLPRPALLAHCNAATPEDQALLAAKGAFIAHAPKTYQKLGMAMPPLPEMLARGMQVGLATDGPASNSDFNMLEILRLTGLHWKGALLDPETLPRTQLLRMTAQTSAAALGFSESGVLAPGRPADLLLLNTIAPHWIPRHDLAAGVVYTAHPSDVAYVWCDGQLLYRKGEFLTLDIERIRWEAERRAFRMVGKSMSSLREYAA